MRDRPRRAVEGLTLTGVAVFAACALAGSSGRTALMYGHVDLPAESFSFKKESGAPQCEDGCAFQDKVFTVEGWNELCLTHCGEIDAMLRDASKGQRQVCARACTCLCTHTHTRPHAHAHTRTYAHTHIRTCTHTHTHTCTHQGVALAQRSMRSAPRGQKLFSIMERSSPSHGTGANDDPFLNLNPPLNPAISAAGHYGEWDPYSDRDPPIYKKSVVLAMLKAVRPVRQGLEWDAGRERNEKLGVNVDGIGGEARGMPLPIFDETQWDHVHDQPRDNEWEELEKPQRRDTGLHVLKKAGVVGKIFFSRRLFCVYNIQFCRLLSSWYEICCKN
jgi:hypothetical protein